jgi:hypothetical protein
MPPGRAIAARQVDDDGTTAENNRLIAVAREPRRHRSIKGRQDRPVVIHGPILLKGAVFTASPTYPAYPARLNARPIAISSRHGYGR